MQSIKLTWQLLLLVIVSSTARRRYKTPIVQVDSGALRGVVTRDRFHDDYYAYYGIPYAVVEQRFQAAKPVPQWEGVFDAQKKYIKCSQRNWLFSYLPLLGRGLAGQENCLTLNVYTPIPKSEERSRTLRPVMVFIHGGGFRDGSSSPLIYGPEYIFRHDVILVTFNYRLEVLGFLCLGIKEAPGNIGLKDQVAALKWIKTNIRAFGGDPDNITLFGESAGSVSVMLQIISPMSRGLFQRAIMQSGSPISPWGFQFEPVKIASQLAKQMGYDTKDPYELYKIFMSKTDEELLITRVPRAKGDIVQSENIFVPCAEKEFPGTQAFLTDTPYNMVLNGHYSKVPLIIGYNSAEGYFFVGKENETTIENMDFYNSLPRDLMFPSKEEAGMIADKLHNLYMSDKKVSKKTMVQLAQFEGESGISYPVTATADMLLKTNDRPIYIYKFAYSGLLNLIKIQSGFGTEAGASHADDLFYLFKPTLTSITGLIETVMVRKLTTMWTNFAKFGDPTPEVTELLPLQWEPADKSDPHLLVIDSEFSTEPLWKSDTFKVWNETYSIYRRNAFNPANKK